MTHLLNQFAIKWYRAKGTATACGDATQNVLVCGTNGEGERSDTDRRDFGATINCALIEPESLHTTMNWLTLI